MHNNNNNFEVVGQKNLKGLYQIRQLFIKLQTSVLSIDSIHEILSLTEYNSNCLKSVHYKLFTKYFLEFNKK